MSPSPLQGAASLGGLEPRVCRTPPIHSPIASLSLLIRIDKDYSGSSAGAAEFSLSSSTLLSKCLQIQIPWMSSLSRGQHSAPSPHPHPSPANTPSGLCFPLFAECFVCLAVVIMLQPSACSESPGEGANFNICLNSSFQTYTNWNNASLGICLLVQFANCGFRSALFSTHQLFVDGAKAGMAVHGGVSGMLCPGCRREHNQGLGKDL